MKNSGVFPESLNNVRQWRDGKYVTSWSVNCIDHRKTAKREGMKTYSSRQPQSIYETVIDVAEGEDVSSDTYCCPNCASVSTISELQEGCRHCGTSFKMSELYPKVTNCFYVYDPHGSSDPLWKTIFKYGLYATPFLIPMCILMNIYQMYQLNGVWPTWPEIVSFSIPYIIFGPLACVPVGGFFTWILSHFFIAGRALGKEGPAMIAVGNSRTRFANAMSRISQEYTFENFAAKIVSLFKIIAFSPNPDDLPFYSGKDVKGFFENVVDVSFRGWMACKKVMISLLMI